MTLSRSAGNFLAFGELVVPPYSVPPALPLFGRTYHTPAPRATLLPSKIYGAAGPSLYFALLARSAVTSTTLPPQIKPFLSSLLLAAAVVGCSHPSTAPAALNRQLLLAAKKGDNAAIQRLLKKGANIEAKDEGGTTPLGFAAEFGHADAVNLLVARGANIVAGEMNGDNALLGAARGGNVKKVEILLQRGASLEAKTRALFVAAESEPLIMPFPVDMPIPIQTQPKQPPNGPPQFPVVDYAQTVRVLLDSGVNIEARGDYEDTPLIRAASFGQTNTVKLLLERGANVEGATDGGDTALTAAACSCAIVDMPDTLDSMKLLLEKKANVNARSKKGATALMSAAGWGRTEIVQMLLDNGAHVDARDNRGDTALLVATSGSALATAEATKLLLARGANVEARNNEGDTPLLLTASKGGSEDVAIVKLLLEHGANVHAKDKHGNTVVALAPKKGHTEIVPLLKKAMAKSN